MTLGFVEVDPDQPQVDPTSTLDGEGRSGRFERYLFLVEDMKLSLACCDQYGCGRLAVLVLGERGLKSSRKLCIVWHIM